MGLKTTVSQQKIFMKPEPIIEQGQLIDHVVAMEADVGSGNWEAAAKWFTSDVAYHVAGRPAFLGVSGIEEYMTWQRSIVTWLGHDSHLVLEHKDTVIIEADSRFRRASTGAEFKLPCTDVYRFRSEGGEMQIFDWRVYADVSHFLDQAFPFSSNVD